MIYLVSESEVEKTYEMFYGEKFESVKAFIDELKIYIDNKNIRIAIY